MHSTGLRTGSMAFLGEEEGRERSREFLIQFQRPMRDAGLYGEDALRMCSPGRNQKGQGSILEVYGVLKKVRMGNYLHLSHTF